MATFASIVNQIALNLHGFSDDQEPRAALTSSVSPSALTFTVDDASNISIGLIEVDDELMWVSATDSSSKTVTIAPFGRGYGGSTAATHAIGAPVAPSPRWPRVSIKQNINHVINQVYPTLFQVKVTQVTASAPLTAYPVPVDVDGILHVSQQLTGPSHEWQPCNRYRLDPFADVTTFPTGKSLSLFNSLGPGRQVKIVYTTAPTLFVNDTDTLASTGLEASTEDLLVYGATARMIQQYEASRLQLTSVSETERAGFITAGAATAASRAMYGLYSQRLDEERARLLRLYPTTLHYTR